MIVPNFGFLRLVGVMNNFTGVYHAAPDNALNLSVYICVKVDVF